MKEKSNKYLGPKVTSVFCLSTSFNDRLSYYEVLNFGHSIDIRYFYYLEASIELSNIGRPNVTFER